MKRCTKCEEILHVSRFYKVKNGKYGVEGACKKCRKTHNKKYREEHKDYYEEYGIFFGMWYGDDKYNPDSYGKFVSVPMDNSDKSEITLIEVNELYGLR